MKTKTTVILLGVLLVLGIFLYAVEFPSQEKEKNLKADEKKVFVFDEDKVKGITLENTEGDFVFYRGAQGHWRLSKPLDTEADRYVVNTMVSTMGRLAFDRVLEEKPADLSIYGLDSPSSRVVLTLEGENAPLALALGKKSPLGSLYVKREDQSRVLLVGTNIDYVLNKKLFDLRDRNVLSFERDEVERVILQTSHKKIELGKKDGGWVVLGRVPLRATMDPLDSLFSQLSSVKVEEFVEDHPRSLAKYGLDHPWGRVGLIVGKDKSQVEVKLGSSAPSRKNKIFATATGKDAVFLLKSDVKNYLERVTGEVMDMRAFFVGIQDVDKFEIVHGGPGGKTLTLTQDSAGHWQIAQAFDLKAKYVAAKELITNLVGTSFSELVVDGPESLAPYGLSRPSSSVRVWTKGDKNPKGLLLGGKKGKFVYAAREGEKAVFIVPEAILAQVGIGLNDLLAPEEKGVYELKLKEQKKEGKKKDNQ